MKLLQKKMTINAHTRIKALLDEDQHRVIDSLIKLNSNFSKLKNPILRNLLARRVTIADACKMAQCTIDEFLNRMQQIGFVVEERPSELIVLKKDVIDLKRKTTVLELDARSYLEQKKDPLREILRMTNSLGIGERLKIINSFEPIPLISLLADKGFLCYTEILEKDLVITWFEKTNDQKVSTERSSDGQQADENRLFDRILTRFPKEKIKYIDVRHLDMPQPMLQILENTDTLQSDELLYVYHRKVPIHLLPELNKKGLIVVLSRKSVDEVDLLIYRS